MRVLLDTFPFIWLTSEPSKLSRLASEVLSDQKNEFYLSDASFDILIHAYNFLGSFALYPFIWFILKFLLSKYSQRITND